MKNFSMRLAYELRRILERLLVWFSPLGNPAFYEANLFPWIPVVETQWKKIRSELDRILATRVVPAYADLSSIQRYVNEDGSWKAFFFYVYGNRISENCALCPETEKALLKIPRMRTAFFSILEPQKTLAPHRGPYKGVLRYHLGLCVPDPALCGIHVGNENAYWEEGKSLVFDDVYFHHAWNLSEKSRVVLFVDFERPLWFPLSLLNRLVISWVGRSKYVREILKNLEKRA